MADVAGQMAMDVLRVAATLQFALAGQFSSVAERNRRRWMSWPGAAGARRAEKTNWRGLVIRRPWIGCQPTICGPPVANRKRHGAKRMLGLARIPRALVGAIDALPRRRLRFAQGYVRRPSLSATCCGSSVVEHSIGNGEVGSSILPRSTISRLKPWMCELVRPSAYRKPQP